MIVRLVGFAAALFAMPKTRALLPVLLVVAAIAALSIGAGAGTAATKKKQAPCWKVLQNDAYDQHIDGTYSIACYNQAIKHVPGDSVIYGELIDQLRQARDNAIADLARRGIKAGPGSLVRGEDSRDLQSHKRHKGLLAAISDKIGPGNGSSIPLPLLVLAGLGLLLIAAAGASFTARWIAARRGAPQPATSPPTPRRK